jgi:soluble lytic murein transglycosylase-like protein
LFADRYRDEIERIAALHDMDAALVRAVIHAESAFNPQARSRAGAQGLMQLMPQTAAELGVGNPFDAEQNIDGGVRYLAGLLQRYDQDVRLATAAYNAGPGAVQQYGGIPPYAETQAYVKRIEVLYRRYQMID